MEERMRGSRVRTSGLNPERTERDGGTKTLGSPTSVKLGGLGGWGGLQVSRCPPQAASLACG